MAYIDVIKAIVAHAFVSSPYPVILSLETHCDLIQQKKMEEILREHLKDQLVTSDTFLTQPVSTSAADAEIHSSNSDEHKHEQEGGAVAGTTSIPSASSSSSKNSHLASNKTSNKKVIAGIEEIISPKARTSGVFQSRRVSLKVSAMTAFRQASASFLNTDRSTVNIPTEEGTSRIGSNRNSISRRSSLDSQCSSGHAAASGGGSRRPSLDSQMADTYGTTNNNHSASAPAQYVVDMDVASPETLKYKFILKGKRNGSLFYSETTMTAAKVSPSTTPVVIDNSVTPSHTSTAATDSNSEQHMQSKLTETSFEYKNVSIINQVLSARSLLPPTPETGTVDTADELSTARRNEQLTANTATNSIRGGGGIADLPVAVSTPTSLKVGKRMKPSPTSTTSSPRRYMNIPLLYQSRSQGQGQGSNSSLPSFLSSHQESSAKHSFTMVTMMSPYENLFIRSPSFLDFGMTNHKRKPTHKGGNKTHMTSMFYSSNSGSGSATPKSNKMNRKASPRNQSTDAVTNDHNTFSLIDYLSHLFYPLHQHKRDLHMPPHPSSVAGAVAGLGASTTVTTSASPQPIIPLMLPVIEETSDNMNHSRSSSMNNNDSEHHDHQPREDGRSYEPSLPTPTPISPTTFQLQFPHETISDHEQSSSKKTTPSLPCLPLSQSNNNNSSPRRLINTHSKDKDKDKKTAAAVVVPSYKPAELYRKASVKVVPVDFDTPTDDAMVWQQQQHHPHQHHSQRPTQNQYTLDKPIIDENNDMNKTKGTVYAKDDTLNSTDTSITQIITPRPLQPTNQQQPTPNTTTRSVLESSSHVMSSSSSSASPRRLIAAKKRISFGLSAAFPMTPKSTGSAPTPSSSTQRAHPDLSSIIAMNAIPVSRLSKAMKQYSVTVTTEKLQYSLDTARDRILGGGGGYDNTTGTGTATGDQESYDGENHHIKEVTTTRLLIPHDLCTSFDEADVLEFTGQNMLTAGVGAGGGGGVTSASGAGATAAVNSGSAGSGIATTYTSMSPRKSVALNLNVGQMRSKKLLAHWAMFHKTHFR